MVPLVIYLYEEKTCGIRLYRQGRAEHLDTVLIKRKSETSRHIILDISAFVFAGYSKNAGAAEKRIKITIEEITTKTDKDS